MNKKELKRSVFCGVLVIVVGCLLWLFGPSTHDARLERESNKKARSTKVVKSKRNSRFYVIEQNSKELGLYDVALKVYIAVDKKTRVQYLVIGSDMSYKGGITPLINEDGKPILYEGELPK